MNAVAMKTLMHPAHPKRYSASDARGKAIGWTAVALVHVIVLWVLISGTARDAVKIIQKPLEAVVLQEVVIPPPPPPPPPPKKVVTETPPKIEAPPPPFVPPPDVAPPQTSTTAPTIEAAPLPPSTPPVIAPPPPPAPTVTAPLRLDIGVACPTQVRPEMPRQAQKDGIEGSVRAQALIRGGKVVEVTILSGPRVFHGSVRSAMAGYVCATAEREVLAIQDFDFKLQ